jgi:hypothetical protein
VLTIELVPEPSSLVLLATALPMVAYVLRRRKPAHEPAEGLKRLTNGGRVRRMGVSLEWHSDFPKTL